MTAARIRRLTLTNFRSYHAAQLEVARGPVRADRPERRRQDQSHRGDLVSGAGRGLRRATLDEVAFSEGDGSWAVAAEVEGALGLATLGTGIEPPAAEDEPPLAQMPHRPRAGLVRPRRSPIICA